MVVGIRHTRSETRTKCLRGSGIDGEGLQSNPPEQKMIVNPARECECDLVGFFAVRAPSTNFVYMRSRKVSPGLDVMRP